MTNEPSKKRRCFLSLSGGVTIALFAVCAITFGAPTAKLPLRQRAKAAYRHAEQLRVRLESQSQPDLAGYTMVIRAFQLVYRMDPGYPKTPAALAAAAEIYQEMGRRFATDRYYSKAVEAYQFLIAQYPGASLSQAAAFAVARIYRIDIENPEAARATYQRYLKNYPYGAKAALARQSISCINEEIAERSTGRSKNASPSVTVRSAAKSSIRPPGFVQSPGSGRTEEVEGIRKWVGANYTRVVIQVGGEVKFNAIHLSNPPRLVFDLANTQISPDLARKVFPVENGFLQRIRVAQFQPTITRVVLDVPAIEDYSVFSIPNPFRLVIDIHGSPATLTSKNPLQVRGAARPAAAPPPNTGINSLSSSQAKVAANLPAVHGNPAHQRERAHPPASVPSGSETTSEGSLLDLPSGLTGASPTLTEALGLKVQRIVIDAGHGGHDTGAIGPGGIEEKDVVLDVALRLRKLIMQRMGCQVIMTRSTDTFIPLEERTAIANQSGADLFISIHANSSHDPQARGIETYFLNFTSDPEALDLAARENATSRTSVYQLQSLIKKIALSEKIGESKKFAAVVDQQLAGHLASDGHHQPDRGVKKAPFIVLIGANMPSILVEISFLSNPLDARLLHKAHYREQIARAVYDGIARYAESLGTIRLAQQ